MSARVDHPAAPAPSELHDYVWRRDDFYQPRYQKSLDASAAVVQLLTDSRLLGGGEAEFIELYRACEELDPHAFARVWQDPSAFAWGVYVYHSAGVLGALDADLAAGKTEARPDFDHVTRVLEQQLEFFKALAIGMHLEGHRDLELRKPLHAVLPFTIPGTRIVIAGTEAVDLAGVRDGRLLVVEDGGERLLSEEPNAGAFIELAPLVTHAGCHFQMNPWVGQVPGIDCIEVQHAAENPLLPGPAHLRAIEQALDWIRTYAPDAFTGFRKWIRCLATKQPNPDGTGGVGSAAFTFLPGLIHIKLVRNPLWLAETFIHESFHNRLFFLDEDTHVLEVIPGPEENYSPWRPDRRPPHGLFHAITVFTPVNRFMFDLYCSGVLSGDDRAYALDFVIRQKYRSRIGIEVLERVGGFTPEGRRIFDEIKITVETLNRDIEAAGLPELGPALYLDKQSARFLPATGPDGRALNSIGALLLHIEQYDRSNQAARWRGIFGEMLHGQSA